MSMDNCKRRRIKKIIFKDRIIGDPNFLYSILEDMLINLWKGLYLSSTDDIVHLSLVLDCSLFSHRDSIYKQLSGLCETYLGTASRIINIYVKGDFLDPTMDDNHCFLDMTMEVRSPKLVTFGLTPNDALLSTAFERVGKAKIKKVIFNPPATVVYWSDGSKTVSKVQDGDTWDSEKGLAMAIIKKTMGLKEFYKHFDEHAVNANFWYGAPEALVKTSIEKYGFEPHMNAIVSKYGTDLVIRYLKKLQEAKNERKTES